MSQVTVDPVQVTAIVALLTTAGAAVRWLWVASTMRLDRRQKLVDEAEAKLARQRDERIAVLEATVTGMSVRIEDLQKRSFNMMTAIHLLVAKIMREDPGAPEITMVEGLLNVQFSGGGLPTTSPDMIEKLNEIDRKTGGRP